MHGCTRTLTHTLTILILLGGALTAGCGGGGGSSDPDLNGWWELTTPDPGPGDAQVLAWLGPASHAGSHVVYVFLDFTFDGTTLRGADPDFGSDDRQEYHLTARSADLLEGQALLVDAGVTVESRDIRMRRVPVPTGSLTTEGGLGGEPVHWDSATAYASVERIPNGDGSADYTVSIIDAGPAVASGILLRFTLPQYSIYPVEFSIPAGCRLSVTPGEATYDAADGAVVLMEVDVSGRIRGTYEAAFGPGGTARGTFDVPVRALR